MEALPIVGSLISSSAAGDAADSQAAGTAAGIAEQRRQFDLVRGDTATARTIGESALVRLARELGINYQPATAGTSALTTDQLRAQLLPQFTTAGTPARSGGGPEGGWDIPATPGGVDEAGLAQAIQQRMQASPGQGTTTYSDVPQEVIDPTKEPGYQFGLNQGQTALDRRIAAMGGRVSGAALKASTRYNQDYATNGYQAAYQRQNSARSERLNRLAALAGMGQTAASTSGNAGAQTSNAISGMLTSQGDATGASQIAQGSIWGNAFNQVAANYKQQANPMSTYANYGYNNYETVPMQPGGGY